MAFIKYVGKKELQVDSLYGSGVRWNGLDDVQEVPDGIAPLLLKHPDCYEQVEQADGVIDSGSGYTPSDTESGRIKQIASVINGFDSEDESLWTKTGKPDVRYIEKTLGYKITSEQRDEAMSQLDMEDLI